MEILPPPPLEVQTELWYNVRPESRKDPKDAMRLTLDLDPRDRTSVRLVETHAFAAGDVYSPLILRNVEGTDPQTLRVFLRRALPGGSLVTVSRTEHPFAAISRLDRQGSMSLSTREMADWCADALGSDSGDARLPNIVADGILEIFDSARLVCRARVPVILRELSSGLLPGQDGRDAAVSVERNAADDGVTVTAVSGDGTVTRADVYDCRLPDVDPYPVRDSDSDSPRMALVVSDGVAKAIADADARSAAALRPVAASAASASEAASAALAKSLAAESLAGGLSADVGTLRAGLSSETAERQAADAALSARLSALEGSDSDASVRDIARSEVAAVVGGAPESFDTLKEVADWIADDATGAAKMVSDISALQSGKVDKESGKGLFSGSYNDLTDRPEIPAPVTVDSGLSPTSENPVQNKVVKAALDAKVSRAEVEDGFTEWTFSLAGDYGVREYFDDEAEPATWNYVLLVGGVESGGVGSWEGRLTSIDFGYYVEGLTATRTRLPTMADMALKADKSEMSVTPGTGANADKTTIQLKTGTSATVLTQHQSLAGLTPMYPFMEAAAVVGEWTFSGTAPQSGYEWSVGFSDEGASGDGEWTLYELQVEAGGGGPVETVSAGESATSLTFSTAGVTATRGRVVTTAPYTVATYTATSTAEAFEIAVGALPTSVTGKARDCILVIDCTAAGAVAPTVTWDTHFHPRTDTATDLAIVEAGKRAVFYISEYADGEFAVGGWQETTGGNA